MKALKTLCVVALMTIIMCVPAFAAGNGLSVGADGAYYFNGVKVCSQWVDCGTYYGYAGADGKVSSGFCIDKTITGQRAAVLSVDQMSAAVMNPAAYTPATPVVLSPAVPVAVAPLSELTEKQRANIEDNFFRRHYYNAGYEQYDDETHKAYCACGEWAFAGHAWFDDDGHDRCSLCGQRR